MPSFAPWPRFFDDPTCTTHTKSFGGWTFGAPSGRVRAFGGGGSESHRLRAFTSGDFDGAREVLGIARAYSVARTRHLVALSFYSFLLASIIQGQLSVALDCFHLAIAEPRFFGHESFAAASLVSCNIWHFTKLMLLMRRKCNSVISRMCDQGRCTSPITWRWRDHVAHS
jgi:hypothetical protein